MSERLRGLRRMEGDFFAPNWFSYFAGGRILFFFLCRFFCFSADDSLKKERGVKWVRSSQCKFRSVFSFEGALG